MPRYKKHNDAVRYKPRSQRNVSDWNGFKSLLNSISAGGDYRMITWDTVSDCVYKLVDQYPAIAKIKLPDDWSE